MVTEFDQTMASRAVLIEVTNVLGAFRDHLVLVGGWVPELLFPNRGHIGSLDVDLAVAPTAVAGNAYEAILKRMLDAGYDHHAPPTRFLKGVAGAPRPVKVDLTVGWISGDSRRFVVVRRPGYLGRCIVAHVTQKMKGAP